MFWLSVTEDCFCVFFRPNQMKRSPFSVINYRRIFILLKTASISLRSSTVAASKQWKLARTAGALGKALALLFLSSDRQGDEDFRRVSTWSKSGCLPVARESSLVSYSGAEIAGKNTLRAANVTQDNRTLHLMIGCRRGSGSVAIIDSWELAKL